MPLTLAVGFAMIASYLLSSTFVPILCVNLLKHVGHHDEDRGLFARFLKGYRKAVGWFVRLRWVVVPAYLAAVRLDSVGAGNCRSAPSCFRRSTRGNSCSGSGRRPARTSS